MSWKQTSFLVIFLETDRGKECKSLKEWIGWYSSKGAWWLKAWVYKVIWENTDYTENSAYSTLGGVGLYEHKNGMDTNGINLFLHSLMVRDKYFL